MHEVQKLIFKKILYIISIEVAGYLRKAQKKKLRLSTRIKVGLNKKQWKSYIL